ncbi:hypothetical protein HDU78_007138 [Chytriomyces hyalinus]|nr:hypothetical protein HDU78_007138 [Chytriomyces hyalinus]
MKLTLLTAIYTIAQVSALAPLEPPPGKVLLGAWYDRNLTDTPVAVNARINYKPLAFFQTDVDFSSTLKPWTAPSVVIPQFLRQLNETQTDAIAYLTVYPFQGFANITDAQLQDMANRLNQMVDAGHSVLLRFGSEMNGNWFTYGQDPIGFIASWKRCITFWRNALGEKKNKVAFVWSPNSGNGYPFPGGEYAINVNGTDQATLDNLKVMDTNQNGILDYLDDPYMPYYPGDEYVDWVGMSIYHYGKEWKWVDNVVPEADKFEHYLQGNPTNGNSSGYYPFYSFFSGPSGCVSNITNEVVSRGNKPLLISETAATFHFAYLNVSSTANPNNCSVPYCQSTATRLDIKRAWWRSFLNQNFVDKFPMMKAISTFEFIKEEELTWRDFTMFGPAPNPYGDTEESVAQATAVVNGFTADAQAGMFPFLVYANAVQTTGAVAATKTSSAASRHFFNCLVEMVGLVFSLI